MKLVLVLFLLLSPSLPAQTDSGLKAEVAELRALVQKLQARVDQLEARAQLAPAPQPGVPAAAVTPQAPAGTSASASLSDLSKAVSLNFLIDTYYAYNFNHPIGRVNLLRAYDVTSNAFSLNQAAVVLESAVDLEHGKRWGARLDLQFGQATATLQGNPVNEPRPGIYRNVFQAYGTYVVPLGSGLTVDFGKFASSLGFENNYTKDQINYSRSYWFNFLPFYHMGARLTYKPWSWLSASYWIVNGTQQTEPFKAYKDQYIGFTAQNRKLSWTGAYYRGQEHPDFEFVTNPGPADIGLPELQGMPFRPIRPAPDGRLHIIDNYLSWQITPKLLTVFEGDYVIERLFRNSAPAYTWGGAAYARYQFLPKLAIGARSEYLSDRGGLFSGVNQALKETTFTFEQKLAPTLMVKEEWRRDWSNQPFFLTDQLGVLSKHQTTATLGLVWWFGPKQGAW
jgi:hypothetical protein